MKPHPHADEEWYRRQPLERQVEMAREHAERLQRPLELAAQHKRRMRIEALQMGAVFAPFGWICCDSGAAVVTAALGLALGWVCSRLDLERLSTAALGMSAFFGALLLLHGSAWTTLFATFPVGALCALIGWVREERGT